MWRTKSRKQRTMSSVLIVWARFYSVFNDLLFCLSLLQTLLPLLFLCRPISTSPASSSSSSSSGIRLDKGASLYLCCFCPQQKSHAHKHHLTRTSQIVFSAELKWSALKRKEKTTQMLNLRSRCVLFRVRAHSDDAEMQRWGGHGGSVPWKRWPQSCS